MEFKEYRDKINQIFAHYTKRGFVNYHDCSGLWRDMTGLLSEATRDLERKGQYKELFDLANKAFLKWGKTDKDDSDGWTQDFVSSVFETWNAVYFSGEEKVSHSKMLEWFMKNMDGAVIDYMEDYLYQYMMDNFKDEEFLNRKLEFLKAQIEKQKNSGNHFQIEYHMPECQIYVLKLMGELHYPIEKIRDYSDTIQDYHVKDVLAEIEISYGNLDKAIAMYEELADRDDKRWGRNKYREMLMKIYKENGNHEKYFNSLKLAMLKAVGDTDLWKEYKSNFNEEEWTDACEEIFSMFKNGDFRANSWYAEENRFDLIMENIETSNDTSQLKTYEKTLKKIYPDRCIALLIDAADRLAEESNKRSDYRRLASLLRWIEKYPNGSEKSEQLAKKYCQAYPRRTAMLEELAKF